MSNEKINPVQTNDEIQAAVDSTHLAKVLSSQSAAIYLSASMLCSPLAVFTIDAHQQYFESFLREIVPDLAASDLDPILKIQVEQVLLCHHNIGRIYADAATVKDHAIRKELLTVAAQLLAEFRRLSANVRQEILIINAKHVSRKTASKSKPQKVKVA